MCQTHHRQLLTIGKLKPIRPYRPRVPGTRKLAGLRVSAGCAEQVQRRARRERLSLSAAVASILEDWYRSRT
jgi:hypothetical protein